MQHRHGYPREPVTAVNGSDVSFAQRTFAVGDRDLRQRSVVATNSLRECHALRADAGVHALTSSELSGNAVMHTIGRKPAYPTNIHAQLWGQPRFHALPSSGSISFEGRRLTDQTRPTHAPSSEPSQERPVPATRRALCCSRADRVSRRRRHTKGATTYCQRAECRAFRERSNARYRSRRRTMKYIPP